MAAEDSAAATTASHNDDDLAISVWDLGQYELDSSSGWMVHTRLPEWTAIPGQVFCHVPSQRFYDATTGADVTEQYAAMVTGGENSSGSAWPSDALTSSLFSAEPASSHTYSSMQGKRPTQEDRHTLVDVLPALQLHRAAYYAIYDGHLGADASEYCAEHLMKEVVAAVGATFSSPWQQQQQQQQQEEEEEEEKPQKEEGAKEEKAEEDIADEKKQDGDARNANTDTDASKATASTDADNDNARACRTARAVLTLAMEQAFLKVDEGFLHAAKIRKRRDGACVISVLLLGRFLVTAHVGDSRAILCRSDGSVVRLTEDHKPEVPHERARIEAAGGFVVQAGPVWRVSPISLEDFKQRQRQPAKLAKLAPPLMLAVARSIGDLEMKKPLPLLTAKPDVSVRMLQPGDAYIVLACDGVWDVMRDEEVAGLLFSQPAGQNDLAGKVVAEAYRRGSTDNISVAAVNLSWTPPTGGK